MFELAISCIFLVWYWEMTICLSLKVLAELLKEKIDVVP